MFVNRTQHERNIALYESMLARSANEAEQWRSMYADMVEKYHALKLQGASMPPEPVKPLPKKEVDRVSEVIGDVAGTNSKLRAVLGSYARRQRACNTPDDEIIAKLLNWDDDDSGVPE